MIPELPKISITVDIGDASEGRCIVHDSQHNSYFRIGIREAAFLRSLDGFRSVQQLQQDPASGYTAEQVMQLLKWLSMQQLLELPASATPKGNRWQRLRRWLGRWPDLRLELINPDAMLTRHTVLIDWLFSKAALCCYLLLLTSPVLLYLFDPALYLQPMQNLTPTLAPADYGWLYLLVILTILGHELAHAICCKHFGGKVNRIGLLFMYLHPLFYCDVSDSWRFPKAQHKVAVAFAGIFFQLVSGALVFSLFILTGWMVLYVYVMLSALLIALNLLPFVRLDGYWLLVHALNEPQLQHRAMQTLDYCFRRQVLRQPLAVQKVKPLYLYFALANLVLVPAFLLLGLYGVFQLLQAVSVELAWLAVCALAAIYLFRLLRNLQRYAKAVLGGKGVPSL